MGRVSADTSPGFQPFGYAGGLSDPDTGLVRFGDRDYDPAGAQWLSRDTIGFSGGANHYAYADGDPINRIDPTGHSAIGCSADLLGVLGMIPVIGTAFDIASTPTYLVAGDWGTAALALTGISSPITASQLKGLSRYGDEALEFTAESGADLLARQADNVVSGELTDAGRALAKQGGRPGSAFPAPVGSPAAISQQGRAIVHKILGNEVRRVKFYYSRLKTQVVDIYDATGRGVRYTKGGAFIGLLEPPR